MERVAAVPGEQLPGTQLAFPAAPRKTDSIRGSCMYYEKNSRTFNLLVGLVLGAVVGAGLVFLRAPREVKGARRLLGR